MSWLYVYSWQGELWTKTLFTNRYNGSFERLYILYSGELFSKSCRHMIKQRRLFINEGYQSGKLPLSNFHRLICLLDFSEIVIDNLHRTTAKKVYKYNLLLMLARTLEALHLHRFNSRHSGYVYILVECTAIILYSRKIKNLVRNKLFISDNGHTTWKRKWISYQYLIMWSNLAMHSIVCSSC